jgi:NAD(P)-dependent dehydrogenase (short-subunit alcohol dehydrogenase family)
MEYKDKTVLVTGSGHGIGKSIALAYAAQGANVIIAEIDKLKGIDTEAAINQGTTGNALFIKTDVRDPHEIEFLFSRIKERFNRLDILINNAGISVWKSPYELTVEEWDKVINTNLRSTFLCSREAAAIMKKHAGGSIINIASTRAFMSEQNSEAYAATKGGIVALTHALAASLSGDHIQVNCISPGWIEKEITTS